MHLVNKNLKKTWSRDYERYV